MHPATKNGLRLKKSSIETKIASKLILAEGSGDEESTVSAAKQGKPPLKRLRREKESRGGRFLKGRDRVLEVMGESGRFRVVSFSFMAESAL